LGVARRRPPPRAPARTCVRSRQPPGVPRWAPTSTGAAPGRARGVAPNIRSAAAAAAPWGLARLWGGGAPWWLDGWGGLRAGPPDPIARPHCCRRRGGPKEEAGRRRLQSRRTGARPRARGRRARGRRVRGRRAPAAPGSEFRSGGVRQPREGCVGGDGRRRGARAGRWERCVGAWARAARRERSERGLQLRSGASWLVRCGGS
jgi:hypothetical protein